MFTMSIDSTQPYLRVTASGAAGLGELSDLAALIAQTTRDQGHSRVLADLSRVHTSLSFTDHLQFGSLAWELLGGIERLAAIVPPGYLDADATRAAQMTGTPLRAFTEAEQATSWVAGTPAQALPRRRRVARRRMLHPA